MPRPVSPVEEVDSRENAEWFQRLPEHAKEDMRARWRTADGTSDRQRERRKQTQIRYLVEGVVLFAGCEFLFWGLDVSRLFILVLPGVALGWACHRLHAGRTMQAVLSAVLFAVVYGLLGLFMIGHFVVFVCLAFGMGYMHEMQRADGSEC